MSDCGLPTTTTLSPLQASTMYIMYPIKASLSCPLNAKLYLALPAQALLTLLCLASPFHSLSFPTPSTPCNNSFSFSFQWSSQSSQPPPFILILPSRILRRLLIATSTTTASWTSCCRYQHPPDVQIYRLRICLLSIFHPGGRIPISWQLLSQLLTRVSTTHAHYRLPLGYYPFPLLTIIIFRSSSTLGHTSTTHTSFRYTINPFLTSLLQTWNDQHLHTGNSHCNQQRNWYFRGRASTISERNVVKGFVLWLFGACDHLYSVQSYTTKALFWKPLDSLKLATVANLHNPTSTA